MRIMASIFNDTTFDLELDKIKQKIAKLYNQLVEKVYRSENPSASPEEIAQFLEDNALEFNTSEQEDFDDEIGELEEALDSMLQEEDLDPVKDKDYKDPKVETGKELKSKTHEKKELKETVNLPEPKGLMATPDDSRKKVITKKVKDPTGGIKTSRKVTPRDISFAPLVEQISDELASLKQRQRIGRKYMKDRL